MTQARLSRGTPYILSSAQVEDILKHLPPRVELAVAATMNLTVEDWRKQAAKVRVKQIIDHQNAGILAATMAAAERAIGDLESASLPAVQPTDTLIDTIIDGLHKRGMIVVNPKTAQDA